MAMQVIILKLNTFHHVWFLVVRYMLKKSFCLQDCLFWIPMFLKYHSIYESKYFNRVSVIGLQLIMFEYFNLKTIPNINNCFLKLMILKYCYLLLFIHEINFQVLKRHLDQIHHPWTLLWLQHYFKLITKISYLKLIRLLYLVCCWDLLYPIKLAIKPNYLFYLNIQFNDAHFFYHLKFNLNNLLSREVIIY